MFLIVAIVKFLDPILIVLAIVGGLISRNWRHVLLAAFVAAAVQEVVLAGLQQTRGFNPVVYLAGVLPAGCWAALVYFIRIKWMARRNQAVMPPHGDGPVP